MQIIISLKTTGNLYQNDVFLSVKEGGTWRVVIIMVIVCEMNSNLIHILTRRCVLSWRLLQTMGLFTFGGGTPEVTCSGSHLTSLADHSLQPVCRVCRESQTPDIVSPGDQAGQVSLASEIIHVTGCTAGTSLNYYFSAFELFIVTS